MNAPPRLLLPDGPSVVAGFGRAAFLGSDGELAVLASGPARARLNASPPPIVCHAPATARRLGLQGIAAADLLELWAFVRPAEQVVPTPRAMAEALGLKPPRSLEDAAAALPVIATALLRNAAASRSSPANRDAPALAALMGAAGWPWAAPLLAALGAPDAQAASGALRVWEALPEWEDTARPPPPSSFPVTPAEARSRLAALLGSDAEDRPGQSDFASAATEAFAPRDTPGVPRVVLAEAGTGTGKTAAYIAPASLWAERNGAPVWLSTYTRNLQRQIDAELARLWPDEAERRAHVAIRKGRENYLCLLNLEDAVNAASRSGGATIALGLMARWAAATRHGDLQGGDLPGWMPELLGGGYTLGLSDRRGECIHAACPHWRRCFIERGIREARTAKLVVANHALVMVQAAWGGLDETGLPLRYVFDEGHHLFDAADSVFAAALSGAETAELRRWLRGNEGGRGRARGLRRRAEDLVAAHPPLSHLLDAALEAARALPAPGWLTRLGEEARPELGGLAAGEENAAEAFLRLVRRQVQARRSAEDAQGVEEAEVEPMIPGLAEAAERLERALGRIATPLEGLREGLAARLDDDAEELESAVRQRIESLGRSLSRRALDPLTAWRAMLNAVASGSAEGGRPGERFVDWLEIVHRGGHEADIGMRRHWVDPTVPFARVVAEPAHGLLVTSATLRDSGAADEEARWQAAEEASGAIHLLAPAMRVAVPSPFDYTKATRAFVVTDVNRNDAAQVAAAYRALFLASGGGALGLFTAIARLRDVHARIAPALEEAGLDLLAQHVDAMDNATLVEVFRAEEDACLLGTDAMRDGVDVPGRALRLIVFDRLPWPRPTILHRARRARFGGGRPGAVDDRIARARLRQAFGRLIRSAEDRGCFVLLDSRAPSRILSVLPEGVEVRRAGLAETVEDVRAFLAPR
ncbi:ATP-dependent DNA helicase [Elioraea rosea]|uniref:ATP-dependent DNA helicase n=1 Tax=Elioraea rosea TaxID=2492390 RepID=UPI001186E8AF|nr:ATP-dependent DNA helicase [Elioraea rosea]